MQKILVTGGAGFIGSNFIYHMLDAHDDLELVCVDVLTYAGCLSTLEPLFSNSHFRFVYGDITDRDHMDALFAKGHFDVVVNFAAESHVDRSIESAEAFLWTNVFGTEVLLDLCRKYGVTRFHQVSTDEVYGDLPFDSDESFSEESPLHPNNPYAATTAAADLLCLSYFRTYGLPVTITRSSNNFGPYQFPEKLIPKTLTLALSGEKVPVYGTGQNIRDWIHVSDHCRAIDLVLQNGAVGEIYNVGGHHEVANRELVRGILNALDLGEEQIEYVKDRPGHDRRYALNTDKIKKDLGFSPEVKLEDGMKDTISWYQTHRTWWEHIADGTYREDNARRLEEQ